MKKLFKLLTVAFLGASTIISCGEDGIDGVNGVDGVDGIDGADGTDGADGKDAVNLNLLSFTKVGTFTNGNDEAFGRNFCI